MTGFPRPAAVEAEALRYSEILKTGERRAELSRMRTIATMLLVLMSAIFLATRYAPQSKSGSFKPISARSRKPAWLGLAPTGSRSSRSSDVPSACPIPHTAVVPENEDRSDRGARALHHQQLSLPRIAYCAPFLDRRGLSRGAMAGG